MDECTDPIDKGRPIPALVIFSAREVLKAGLDFVCSLPRILRVKGDPCTSKTNVQRFKAHCGANPAVLANIWANLQTTNAPEACIRALHFGYFLEALCFNYRYKTELEREAQWDESPKTLRKWCWHCLIKIQRLQGQKIVFAPVEEFGDDIVILSVDGTDNLCHEIAHPELSQNRDCYTHKKHHAGLGCELGIHLYEPKLMWMNGSFAAGKLSDKTVFTSKFGLRDKLATMKKKCVVDKGCTGHGDVCYTFNANDDAVVKAFKSRAQMRHEQFNGMLKEFSSLANMFRHDQEKFEVCFEASCVICQCRMEHGEPLFDLVAGIQEEEEEDYSDEE